MKLVSFISEGKSCYGVGLTNGVVELSNQHPEWKTLRDVIHANGIGQLVQASKRRTITHNYNEIEFTIPIPDPEKIICVGINYPARADEYKDDAPPPVNPSLFVRFPNSFSGHREPIFTPHESDMLDYEGELAIIIGKGGRRIQANTALNHVCGLTLCNEGTVRDWVRHAKFNVTQGKNFDRSGSMGPWMVIYEDHSQLADITLQTRVNGKVRQKDRTSRMVFKPDRLIEYISTFTTLKPGDIIVTGTPVGSGARMDPPQYLQPGDTVEVEAEGIGCLCNYIHGRG